MPHALEDADSPHDDAHSQPGETLRRASLYGTTSAKRLPTVRLQPRDARTRRELQVLMAPEQVVIHHGLSVYEDELELRKHHEHLGTRPALDQSHALSDLFTTVPKQLGENRGIEMAKHGREWRVGYKNDPQSDFHGVGMRGVFEPSDTIRERLIHNDVYMQSSTAVAYPTPTTSSEQVAAQLQPFDEVMAYKEMEGKLHVGMTGHAKSPARQKPHWKPASLRANPTKKNINRPQKQGVEQRYAIREVSSPNKKSLLQMDERCLQKRQALVQKTNASYEEVKHHAQQQTDPTVRYSLPIENPQYDRAYRLGLDRVPSSPALETPTLPEHGDEADCGVEDREYNSNQQYRAAKRKNETSNNKKTDSMRPPVLFRPKSAITLRMDTTLSPTSTLGRSASSTALLVASDSPGKVAGAKRRPHSASIAYLSNSTVYCVETPASNTRNDSRQKQPVADMVRPDNAHVVLQQQRKFGAEFLGVVLQERERRRAAQQENLLDLARRGILHSIPMPQIFARLRREALKNLTKRVEYARYEKLPLEEYMSLCAMAVVEEPPGRRHEALRASIEDDENDDDEAEPDRGTTTSRKGYETDENDPVIRALKDEVEIRQLPFDEPANSVFRKRRALRPDPVDGNNSSTIVAMRSALFVTRDQFHIALEAFALQARDVNLLFSALDLEVEDNVAIWEIICAVERLQDNHEEIRRSRVQVKARHLPKDLATLRRSVTIPHLTHIPLPVGTFQ